MHAVRRIDAEERLVEKHHRGVAHQRDPELQPLAHAPRPVSVPTIAVFGETDRVEGLGGQRLRLGSPATLGDERHLEVLAPRERGVEVLRRGHERKLGPNVGVVERAPPEHQRLALARLNESGDHAHQCGLAAAVRAHETGDARTHVERDVGESDDLAVEHAHARQVDGSRALGGERRRASFDHAHGVISRRTRDATTTSPRKPYAASTTIDQIPNWTNPDSKSPVNKSFTAEAGPSA